MSFLETLNRLLGDPNEKELKRIRPMVAAVRRRGAEADIRALTLEDVPKKTAELKAKVQSGTSLNDVLPEAFAVAIRACELLQGKSIHIGKQEFTWHMVPFDVQILGGIVLHRGNISEMKTGEGKTLVCTLPIYLNALTGKGAHVVTVNDYLARRDSQWMGMLYSALGMTVGTVVHGLTTEQRREAYGCDITYGTNNEYGFDYLRDNMATSLAHQVQRGLHYAIVDEVDSILIDEARTPLIISQPAAESTVKYVQYAQLVRGLEEKTHFTRDEKQRTAVLTEEGIRKMEELLGVQNIYTERGFEEVHHIEQALRSHAIYRLDVDYVVKEGEIIIVDEFTGRLMPGRRYGHGLHQAIEAKEGVDVQRESRTLATITFQNYFRLYDKLAGMTGTAKTEEEEFESIYKLRTIVIPTHRPMVRKDKADAIYRTVASKFRAVAKIAKEKYALGQPVLIGTTSIEKSEAMSVLLQEEGVPHQVLNAKQHEKEADIVANAGQKQSITIATNMAGRGTDIKLGEGVQDLGGLCILGTERHEARRIDNQLRGRSGRQGDPGESQFFVSMEDDLMRLFGGDRLKSMMERLHVPDDQPLESRMVSRSIESAQKKVEGRNFDIRRHVLQYDDVMNKHREIIYKRRQKILVKITEGAKDTENTNGESPLHAEILEAIAKEAQGIANTYALNDDAEQWDREKILAALTVLLPGSAVPLTNEEMMKFPEKEFLVQRLRTILIDTFERKCAEVERETAARAESIITLRSIDAHWMDHIDDMSHLREQVAFSGYAQRDPLIEYQDQGFRRFGQLLATINATIVRALLQTDFAEFATPQVLEEESELQNLETNAEAIERELESTGAAPVVQSQPLEGQGVDLIRVAPPPQRAAQNKPSAMQQVGRNDPCPCGSGRKYKKCHGR
ncbi:MAG: preprotein translocase subunit SecA [Candidatus Peregrinibacteria bacterium]|nr:preprotein translocase subunit SecA [Candidatus Peregrinibacteria bacterium]